MQAFSEAIDNFEQLASQLNLAQIQVLNRKIIDNFLQQLPDDWEKTELKIEQPYLLKLAELLREPNWNFKEIGNQLQALDNIADKMEDYPADMDFLPITLLNMIFFTQQIANCKRTSKKLKTAFLNLIEQYLNVADYVADNAGVDADENFTIQDDKWLSYPLIKQAVEQLMTWINDSKV